jgi:hypothetical protein
MKAGTRTSSHGRLSSTLSSVEEEMSRARRNFITAVTVLALGLSALSQTQVSPQPDLQTQIDQAQKQVQLAQAERDKAQAGQAKAEAQAAAFKAKLGSINTTDLPKGTVTADDKVVIEANYLAYAAATQAAGRIADALGGSVCSQNLAFYTGKDQDAIQAYLLLKQQVTIASNNLASLNGALQLNPVPSSVLPQPDGELKSLYVFRPPQPAAEGVLAQPPPPAPAGQGILPATPAEAFGAIDAVMGLISLFKTDTTYSGISVASDDLALQALVASAVRKDCRMRNQALQIYHPTYSYSTTKSAVLEQLQTLSEAADKFVVRATELEQYVKAPFDNAITSTAKQRDRIVSLESELKTIKDQMQGHPSPKDKAKLQSQRKVDNAELGQITDQIRSNAKASSIADATDGDIHKVAAELLACYAGDQYAVQQRLAALKSAAGRVSDLVSAVSTPDSNGTTPLQSILRAEALQQNLGPSFLLMTKIVSVGGNNITKKNAFWSSLSFSGGIVAEYFLNNNLGAIVQSGTVECYGGRIKEDDLQKGLSSAAGIVCSPELEPTNPSLSLGAEVGAGK